MPIPPRSSSTLVLCRLCSPAAAAGAADPGGGGGPRVAARTRAMVHCLPARLGRRRDQVWAHQRVHHPPDGPRARRDVRVRAAAANNIVAAMRSTPCAGVWQRRKHALHTLPPDRRQ
eukprot:355323-Chlamydomonas_euryale.AAC.1